MNKVNLECVYNLIYWWACDDSWRQIHAAHTLWRSAWEMPGRILNLSGIVWKSRRSFLPTHDGPITNSRINRQKVTMIHLLNSISPRQASVMKSRGIAGEKVRAMKYYDDLIPTEEWWVLNSSMFLCFLQKPLPRGSAGFMLGKSRMFHLYITFLNHIMWPIARNKECEIALIFPF